MPGDEVRRSDLRGGQMDLCKDQRCNLDPIKSNNESKLPANHGDSEGPGMQACQSCKDALPSTIGDLM